MDQRDAELRERAAEAERTRAASEAEARALDTARREMEEHRQAWHEEAEREVDRWREEQLGLARLEIERTEERWRESLAREQAELLEELQERVGGLVTTTLRQVLPEFADATMEAQALQRFLRRLEDLEDARRAELAGALQGGVTAVVQSASELPAEDRESVRQTLARELGPAEHLTFQVAPTLICGLTLRIGGFTLGWNLRDVLQQLEDEFALGLRAAGE